MNAALRLVLIFSASGVDVLFWFQLKVLAYMYHQTAIPVLRLAIGQLTSRDKRHPVECVPRGRDVLRHVETRSSGQ